MSTLDTLLHAVEARQLQCGGDIIFIGAQYCEELKDTNALQYFYPYGRPFSRHIFDLNETCPHILMLAPKNATETKYLIAKALQALEEGGVFICAADNKSGGTRLKKILQEAGLADIQDISKNKARAVSGVKQDLSNTVLEEWLDKGAVQDVLGGAYISQPGIFGWDKIDKGSEILTRYIPADLSGSGADFGCGYGYLSRYVLQHCPQVKSLVCVDADYRSVMCCEENLKETQAIKKFIWDDLTRPDQPLSGLDFIVMNPPFHEGRSSDSDIGLKFIGTAHKSLKKGGALYMVANAHLPYEKVLSDYFHSSEMLVQESGFKVFKAVK